MHPSGRDDGGPVLGRDAEIEALTSLLAAAPNGGGALVLRGDPGIGKSRLLAVAAASARDRGFTVLGATGVQSEARLAFAGLHQLLRPVRAHVAALPPVLRHPLETALGFTGGTAPERFRVALAVLELLSDIAAGTPLLVMADDAHWLDRETADVLGFVARRLEDDPIVLLAAVRDGHRSSLIDAGLRELAVAALEPGPARQLLMASGPQLTSAARARLQQEAAGNPLALTELPASAAEERRDATMPGLVPLTDRLEQAFAARVSDLPEPTQLLLVAAALGDGDRVSEAVRAASAVAGTALGIEALEPAAAAAIVDLDERSVRFRHPLMRSAVVQSTTAVQRRRVHEALAEVLHADPDRCVWHRAALITGSHEDVARELEEAADRAKRRGAIAVAATALRRSAELSDPAHRGPRLLAAAQLTFELGRPDVVGSLVREAERLELGPVDQARTILVKEVVDLRPLGGAGRTEALIAMAERAGDAGDRDLHVELLWLVAQHAFWDDPGAEARRSIIEAARRLGATSADDARLLAIEAFADPFGAWPEVTRRLRSAAAERTYDAELARYLGAASVIVGAFDAGGPVLDAAVDGLRAQGRLGHLPRLLGMQATVATRLADWDVAIPAAEEARRLAAELSEPLAVAAAETVVSMIAGMRGDEAAAEHASARAEGTGSSLAWNVVVSMAQFGRILAALGAARFEDAYALAERLFDPADPAHHPVFACWHIGDLAEAALHVDRVDEARSRVGQVESAVGLRASSWIDLSLRHARVVLADDDDADALYEEALEADWRLWPFPRARLLLAHGRRLRRVRRIADSRAPLRAARDGFDALGCAAWADQARRELRASGEASRRRDPAARDQLTAQELQIAQLAAQGLSNREIGQRLYLSHRTIGTHLYRVFPKLGITARTELAAALDVDQDRAGPGLSSRSATRGNSTTETSPAATSAT